MTTCFPPQLRQRHIPFETSDRYLFAGRRPLEVLKLFISHESGIFLYLSGSYSRAWIYSFDQPRDKTEGISQTLNNEEEERTGVSCVTLAIPICKASLPI